MGILENYARKKLQQQYLYIKRQPVLPDFDKIRKVGVIWQPAQKVAFEYLQDFFSKKKVIFRHLCFINEKVKGEYDSNTLTKNDLDWLGFPKKNSAGILCEQDFDLIFNISTDQNITLDYLSAMTSARFKTGFSLSQSEFFDLNIKIEPNQDSLFLVKQQIFYIGQLNKSK